MADSGNTCRGQVLIPSNGTQGFNQYCSTLPAYWSRFVGVSFRLSGHMSGSMGITEENLMKLLLTEVWAVLLDPLNDDEASSSISSKVLSGAPWRQERER